MKRVFIYFICIVLVSISIFINIPVVYAADNDFTLSIDYNTINNKNCSLSYDEANNAVNNHGDIYSSDHELAFRYSPNGNYNWISSGGSIYFSDNQLFNFLRSDCNFKTYSVIAGGVVSNNGVIRSLLKGCGFLVGKDSSLITGALDSLTGNYNYLNDMTYSETDGLTIGKDTAKKLKDIALHRYYDSIGAIPISPNINTSQGLVEYLKPIYEYEEDYIADFKKAETYDFAIGINYSSSTYASLKYIELGNTSDFGYMYTDLTSRKYGSRGYPLYFVDNSLDLIEYTRKPCISLFGDNDYTPDLYFNYSNTNFGDGVWRPFGWFAMEDRQFYLGTNKAERFVVFKSYEALYNYVHGSQTAYVSSKINEASEDITVSIDDMNNNISDKLDSLIDSINNKKEGMSSQELQDAIDKGLADIGKNTEDIKDNTTDIKQDTGNILDVLKQQNDILLQILGVTEYIAYNKGDDKNNYTMSDVSNCFNTMFSSLQYAVLYGVNKTGQNEASTVSYAADTDTYSTEDLDYRNGLFGKFPFSVPYQLYEWLQVLQTDPVAPMFTYNYGFLIGHTNEQAYDITFDLKQFESWAAVGKSFLRLSFTLLFAIGIYKRFKGEV